MVDLMLCVAYNIVMNDELDFEPADCDSMGLIIEIADYIRKNHCNLRFSTIKDNLIVFHHDDHEKRIQYRVEIKVTKSRAGFFLAECSRLDSSGS